MQAILMTNVTTHGEVYPFCRPEWSYDLPGDAAILDPRVFRTSRT